MNPDYDNRIAVMAVEPGTTSGVGLGILPRSRGQVWKQIEQAERIESYDVDGEPALQAWEIMAQYREWSEPYRYRALAVEDFAIRLGPGASSRRELLDPVRVANAMEALCFTLAGG